MIEEKKPSFQLLGVAVKLYEVIWRDKFVDKIETKHHVTTEEAEHILFGDAHFRREEKGHVQGEDLYAAYGRTNAGRYLIVFFINKRKIAALPISARDMTDSERRYYAQQKKAR
jgi:hypothetical protein